MTAVDPVDYLCGAWDVDRAVLDLGTGGRGAFRGTARGVVVAAGVLCFEEEGEMTVNGHRGPARRTFELVRTASGRADVRFADGRHFHSLELGPAPFAVEHRCGADSYRGEFQLHGSERWSSVWEVCGPAKRYRLATSYARRAGLPEGGLRVGGPVPRALRW